MLHPRTPMSIGLNLFVGAMLTCSLGHAFEFPVTPQDKEWKKLKTHAEMVQVTQIPEHVLKSMTTDALIEAYFNYPLLGDMFAFNSIQQGFENVAANFNGLQELLKREDAAELLTRRYAAVDLKSFARHSTLVEQGNFALQSVSLEVLLSQHEVLAQIQTDKKKRLVEDTLSKIAVKMENPNVYGSISLTGTAYLMGRSLESEQFDAPTTRSASHSIKVDAFLKNAEQLDGQVLTFLIEQGEAFINQ